MNYLLDTHTLLWFIGGDKQLPEKNRKIIEDPTNRLMVSAASLFEITIKVKVGKMDIMTSLKAVYQDIEASFIGILPIMTTHLLEYQNIPLFANHRDPFDRVIVATAIVEKAKIITVDPKFQYYRDLVDMVC